MYSEISEESGESEKLKKLKKFEELVEKGKIMCIKSEKFKIGIYKKIVEKIGLNCRKKYKKIQQIKNKNKRKSKIKAINTNKK
jgi:hypothetical protein